MAEPAGGRIGSYRILEEIGDVVSGTAYRALDEGSGTALIVLRIPAPPSDLAEEARRLPRIFVPGIPSVYEVWEEGEDLLLAFEEVRGRSLEELLAAGERVDRSTLASWGSQLLVLLAEAHAQGVLHRHLGSRSAVLTPDGRLALRAFGLTRLEADPSVTVAPEVAAGEPAGVATDLHALGTLLMRLAEAGDPPVLGSPHTDPLAAVLSRATAVDPRQRWSDAAEMERALRRAEQEPAPPIAGTVPPSTGSSTGSTVARPRRRGLWAAAAVVLVLGAAAVFSLLRARPPAGSAGAAPQNPSPPAAAAAAAPVPDDPAAMLRRALGLLQEGQEAEGEALLARLLDEALLPNPAPALEALGTLRLRSGRTAEAAELLRRAAALTPSAEIHYKLGLALAAEGRREEALESLRSARELAPDSREVRRAIENLEAQP